MQSNNYIVIQGWMCNELGLKGNELLIFAMIHGFSQDGISKFHGGRKYIADTFNISLPTVDKALQSLVSKQYICKEEFDDFVNPNIYWVNFEVVKKLYEGSKETLHGGSKETLLNKTSKQTDSKKRKVVSKDTTTDFQFGSKLSKPKKENLYTKCVNMVSDFVSEHNCGEPVRGKLMDYLRFRLEVKDKPLYTNMWKGMLGKLETLHRQGYGYETVISYSLERGYLSFYAPNNFSSGSVKNKPWEQGVKSETYTEEEKRELEKIEQEMIEAGEQVWY